MGDPQVRALSARFVEVDPRTLLRLDAIFEIALGTLLALAWPLGWFDLAGWEGWPAAVIGLLLIAVGAVLWVAPADAPTLRLLALANAGGALLFAVWLAVFWDSFDAAGALLVLIVIAALAALAAAEWRAAARSLRVA
jgi:hypothetical protein